NAAHTLARPSIEYWLGTDNLGRDIYSRIVHGARVSLIVGLASTLLGSALGGVIGLLSGYAGGKVDLVTQRALDILQGLPLLVLALVMSAALGPSISNVVIAISVPIIPRAARVLRSSVLSIREMQYVRRPGASASRTSASPSVTCCRTPSDPSSCCARRSWAARSSSRPPCPFSASVCRSPIRPGGACSRSRPR